MAQQTGAIYHQGILYSGGGGTNVTPNPQGEATDTLNTVEIDGTVYGIEGGGGSNLIIDAQRYSLEEKVVGIWTDGKPLYQRTWEFSNSVSLSANTWFTSSIPNTNMERIVNVEAMSETGTRWTISGARDEGSYVNLICFRNSAITVKYVTLQYTKTTDTAGSGGYQAYGFSPIIYSDVEREVGVWRDNKPLYQRTFAATSPSATDTSTSIITMPTGIENVVSLVGFINQSGAIAQENLNFFMWYRKPQNDIACRVTNTNWKSYPMFVTVRYTKTTDVAGSGEYNTLAIPNVHYSTDEQVIGTWIDGKTLYQRTFEVATTTKGDWVVIINDASILIKEYEGKTYFANGNRINVDHFIDTSNYGTGLILNNGHQFQAIVYNTVNNIDKYIITLKYTKTTD